MRIMEINMTVTEGRHHGDDSGLLGTVAQTSCQCWRTSPLQRASVIRRVHVCVAKAGPQRAAGDMREQVCQLEKID